jgi:uncharacterized membrane protein HdeD (DUF308 family)
MAIPLDAAAAAMREAMRETVKKYSFWYLVQGVLMVAAGLLALIYPLSPRWRSCFCSPGS